MGAPVKTAEILAVLSLATDLAMGQPLGFGLRLCLASLAVAKALKTDAATRAEVYYHALLRHAGCTAQTDRLAALFGDEIALRQSVAPVDLDNAGELLPVILRQVRTANAGKRPIAMIGAVIAGMLQSRQLSESVFVGQCEAAARLAGRLGLPEAVQRNLGQIYERWDGKGIPAHLSGEAIGLPVRIVGVVQDALTLLGMMAQAEALEVIEERAAAAYDPKLVVALRNDPSLLGTSEDEATLWAQVMAQAPGADPLAEQGLDGAIEVIADFIDLKAPTIAGHSRAVAALAQAAALQMGLDPRLAYRAGLLHDLGYAAVPTQSRLETTVGEQGRLHPYYGERLLIRSAGLAPLGAVIGEHHERLDGSGFHRGAHAAELSAAGRLLAAAEAYQSLVEDRPFRVTLKPAGAAARLREAARAGTLDGAAVTAVLEAAGQGGGRKKPALPAGLTGREADILCRVARGTPVKAIARELGLSPKTVSNHVQNVYAKIGVTTRSGATLFAIERGLLRPGSET